MELYFARLALKDLDKIDRLARVRIIEKLKFYISQKDPLSFAKPLAGDLGWRYRIGDYRIIFDIDNNSIIILKIGHRKDIYR